MVVRCSGFLKSYCISWVFLCVWVFVNFGESSMRFRDRSIFFCACMKCSVNIFSSTLFITAVSTHSLSFSFCLDDLSILESGVLTCPIYIVWEPTCYTSWHTVSFANLGVWHTDVKNWNIFWCIFPNINI